jgi:hypothetical protein
VRSISLGFGFLRAYEYQENNMLNKILISVLMMCATPAFGLILDFDDVRPEEYQYPGDEGFFTESGFTIDGFSSPPPGGVGSAGAIHMDDSGADRRNRETVVLGSKRFDALSMRIIAGDDRPWYTATDPTTGEYLYRIDPVTGYRREDIERFDYPNLLVQGVRDGAIVAETRFSVVTGASNYTLPSDFTRLDSLILKARTIEDPALAGFFQELEASLALRYPGMILENDCYYPCRHFDFDALEVHPTPLPGALVLMLSAILGGGITRRFMTRERAV